jgi:hypothetical protein
MLDIYMNSYSQTISFEVGEEAFTIDFYQFQKQYVHMVKKNINLRGV